MDTSEDFILNRADGSTLTFKRVLGSGRVAFRKLLLETRKAALAHSLTYEGVQGEALRKQLNDFDARAHRIKWPEVARWANDPEGQLEAILLSLQRDNPKAGEKEFDVLNLDDYEMLQVAAGVLNLKLFTQKEDNSPFDEGLSNPPRSTSGDGKETSSGATAESPTPSPSPVTSGTAA